MRNVPVGIDAIQGLRRAIGAFGVSGRVVTATVEEPFTGSSPGSRRSGTT